RSSVVLCHFLVAISLGLLGCASKPLAEKTTAVFPQDYANTDVQHDHTSYQAGFSHDRQRTRPILFIVGDSTVHNYSGGRVGWGDVIGKYFDTNRIIVENHALAGRSSRTFITQGWWDLLLREAKPGDFVLIQMGHNDAGPLDDTNRARGSIGGVGDEQKEIFNPVRHEPETVRTYGWYLRKYISDARAHGMTPLLCSPVPHVPKAKVKSGEVENVPYVHWAAEVAAQEKVPFIHLNELVMSQYVGMTPQQVKAKYFTKWDNTHSSAAGAALNASCVVIGLAGMRDCPLKDYFRQIQLPKF
ncbi:MAG TPA: rhamnogalacturonan acetylesterase, partial [Verrucomicrobiae bacterium]|nr:rhamnogalacturonan acetylesterase [Verrucomicrobiae bacterium]